MPDRHQRLRPAIDWPSRGLTVDGCGAKAVGEAIHGGDRIRTRVVDCAALLPMVVITTHCLVADQVPHSESG